MLFIEYLYIISKEKRNSKIVSFISFFFLLILNPKIKHKSSILPIQITIYLLIIFKNIQNNYLINSFFKYAKLILNRLIISIWINSSGLFSAITNLIHGDLNNYLHLRLLHSYLFINQLIVIYYLNFLGCKETFRLIQLLLSPSFCSIWD